MKSVFEYWVAVEATCTYLRKYHSRENAIGYNATHPLAVAIWDMWTYRMEHD